ncbi:putative fructosyl amino acid protein [Diplogelasinospora grovesii]|uniref:Fructosyl amino acid protein n=1 Tax=Diplogelasinospora grovesii TaxID=303347 RepID=A0AAN6NGY6_9PEZI|nr:putative fructosyl amino acid protein [Diplogelasinospora grovesii]
MAAPASSLSSPIPPSSSASFSPPSSILIIGSGVFGLGSAWSLARRDAFSQCSITVVDRSDAVQPDVFPARDAASVDTSRIIRADYADPAYAALAAEAQVQWRKQAKPEDLGAQGRYHESGLVLVADAPLPTSLQNLDNTNADRFKKKTGMEYVRDSWENVRSMASIDPNMAGRVRELPDVAAIREAAGTGGSSGAWGYVNESSGWADAGASMAWLYDQVRQTGRVTFISGTVTSLEHHDNTVTGAKLSDGRVLSADLVILAAGSWTGALLDLSGQATATGQVLGYLDLTEEEQQRLSKMPVLLNFSTGLFVIPPSNRVLKFARHAYGYINPTTLGTAPLPSSPKASITPLSLKISQTYTQVSDPTLSIPAEGEQDLRRALREMVPLPGLEDRPFTKTRLCWYMDTPTADFLIDYQPHWQGLFIATGGSGHAFKFLPVIGDKIVDCIMRNCPAEFKEKWAWKQAPEGASSEDLIVTEDGSRGGRPGLILAEQLGRPLVVLN